MECVLKCLRLKVMKNLNSWINVPTMYTLPLVFFPVPYILITLSLHSNSSSSQSSLPSTSSSLNSLDKFLPHLQYTFVQYIVQVFCSSVYVRRGPSKASPKFCAIPGGKPPSDGQSLPRAGEEQDSNLWQLQRCQVCNHWATFPPIHSSHPPRSIFEATTHTPPLSLYWHHRLLLFTPSILPHSPLLVHSS
jgi:hypothetical protein